MRKWVSLWLVLVGMMQIGYVWGMEEPDEEFFDAQETLPSDVSPEEEMIRASLAPMKEDGERIQGKIASFKQLLIRDQWDEKAINEVLAQYRNLNRSIDVFPLRYQPVLDDMRRKYRSNLALNSLLHEYSQLMRDVTFGLIDQQDLIQSLESIRDTFTDARLAVSDIGLPLSSFTMSALKRYESWHASQNLPALQQYVNQTAKNLLATIERRGLYKQEMPPPTFEGFRYPSDKQIGREKGRLHDIRKELEQNKQRLEKETSIIAHIVHKQTLDQDDLEKLAFSYAAFSALLVGKGDLLGKVHAVYSSALGDEGLGEQKYLLEKDIQIVYAPYIQKLKQFDRMGLNRIKDILETLVSTKITIQKVSQHQKKERLVIGWRFIKNTFSIQFPLSLLEKLSILLAWQSSCKALQNVVRLQAKEALEHVRKLQQSPVAEKVAEFIEAFYRYEQEFLDAVGHQKTEVAARLEEFKKKISSAWSVGHSFRSSLMERINEMLQGVVR